jgi:hypothetical protein
LITIFTALYPEAKELIRALSLKKDMTQNHFQVFSDENNQIQIVITGASAIAAATAVAECSTKKEPDSGDFLINYGSCAGRKNIPVGTVSLCNKLTQTVDGRTFYPDILYRHPFGEAELYSFPAHLKDTGGNGRYQLPLHGSFSIPSTFPSVHCNNSFFRKYDLRYYLPHKKTAGTISHPCCMTKPPLFPHEAEYTTGPVVA